MGGMKKPEIPWRSKYDMVISLRCTRCKTRIPSLEKELDRVGLVPDACSWSVPDAVEQAALPLMRVVALVKTGGYASCTFNHYRAIRTAYELGANRVLLVEDDVRFLKNLELLSKIVANTPCVDIAMYDLVSDGAPRPTTADIRRMLDESVQNFWATPQRHPCSMACVGLTRRGMSILLSHLCDAFDGHGRFDVIDGYLDRRRLPPGTEIKVAWPLAAVQAPNAGCTPSNTSIAFGAVQEKWYSDMGVDARDYGGCDDRMA